MDCFVAGGPEVWSKSEYLLQQEHANYSYNFLVALGTSMTKSS